MSGKPGGPDRSEPLLGPAGLRLLDALRDWRLARLLFDDDGRIGRRALWFYLLAVMGLAFIIVFSRTLRQTPWVHAAIGIALLFPSYCVFAKRLQDIGIAGGWAVIIVLISATDLVLAASGLKSRPGRFAAFIETWQTLGLVNMAFLFGFLGLWPGSSSANRFGLRWPPW